MVSQLLEFDLVGILGPQVAWLLALIAADVISGVARAIREGKFDLAKLAGFYRSNVVPLLLGWLATEILVRFLIPGDWPDWMTPALSGVAFGAVVLTLLGSIGGNLVSIGILPQAAGRLGIRPKE